MPWTTPPGAGATVHIWNGYSLAERDRRWNAVRANAAAAGLDCVWVPLCLDPHNFSLSPEQPRGARSDARSLTLMENASIVLPTDGRTMDAFSISVR